MTKNRALENITSKRLEEIALDYIVNSRKQSELQSKFNLSKHLVSSIIKEMKLVDKRKRYQEKLLEKSLERCSTYQSKIIVKATEIINGHIQKLSDEQKKENAPKLSSSEIRDVMAILQIVSKENRLDNDQPTEKMVKEVKIQFPEGFIPITQNSKPDVITEAVVVEEKKITEAVIEEAVEEIIVEIDDGILENPLG